MAKLCNSSILFNKAAICTGMGCITICSTSRLYNSIFKCMSTTIATINTNTFIIECMFTSCRSTNSTTNCTNLIFTTSRSRNVPFMFWNSFVCLIFVATISTFIKCIARLSTSRFYNRWNIIMSGWICISINNYMATILTCMSSITL